MSRKITIINGIKTCSVCGDNKPIEYFYKSSRPLGYHSSCKDCISLKNKEKYRIKSSCIYF